MSKPENLALELIEKEKREKTGFLDLGDCGLTELPKEAGELFWLEALILTTYYHNEDGKWARTQNREKPNTIETFPDCTNYQ